MGMMFHPERQVRLTPGPHPQSGEMQSVTITLDTKRLRQLMQKHQLHADEFSCADDVSRARLRALLLSLACG